MGFGTSFNLVYVDCIDWVHTLVSLRLLRAIIGVAISAAIFYVFYLIPTADNPSKFFFAYFLPYQTISVVMYGVYPVLCNKLSLVKVHEQEKQRIMSEITRSEINMRAESYLVQRKV